MCRGIWFCKQATLAQNGRGGTRPILGIKFCLPLKPKNGMPQAYHKPSIFRHFQEVVNRICVADHLRALNTVFERKSGARLRGMRRPQPIHCSHISISAVNLAKFLGRHYNFGMRFEAIEGGRSCQFLGNPATAKSNPIKGPPSATASCRRIKGVFLFLHPHQLLRHSERGEEQRNDGDFPA